jgi:hypothetical protein
MKSTSRFPPICAKKNIGASVKKVLMLFKFKGNAPVSTSGKETMESRSSFDIARAARAAGSPYGTT